MDLLYKKYDYVVDVEGSRIMHEQGRNCLTFNFESMYFYVNGKKSTPQAIRYDIEKDRLMYWSSKKWNYWSDIKGEAISSLFHTYQEYKLLS